MEFDKLSAAITAPSKEEALKWSGEINTIVAEMIVELSIDGETGMMVDRIKQKLNDLLWKYKHHITKQYSVKTVELEDRLIEQTEK